MRDERLRDALELFEGQMIVDSQCTEEEEATSFTYPRHLQYFDRNSSESFQFHSLRHHERIGPLHCPVTRYGINYVGTQKFWDATFKTKESRAGLVRVPLFWDPHCVSFVSA